MATKASKIRQLLIDHPEMSKADIAEMCGSTRAHVYNIASADKAKNGKSKKEITPEDVEAVRKIGIVKVRKIVQIIDAWEK